MIWGLLIVTLAATSFGGCFLFNEIFHNDAFKPIPVIVLLQQILFFSNGYV